MGRKDSFTLIGVGIAGVPVVRQCRFPFRYREGRVIATREVR